MSTNARSARLGRGMAAALAAVLSALLLVPAAGAHQGIVSTRPSGAAEVGLTSVSAFFGGPVRSGTLKVFDADGAKVSRGQGGRDPRNVSRVRAALKPGLGPGRYTARVSWVDGDGHLQRSSFQFRLVR